MNRIVVTTRVGSDGSIRLNVPVGADEAGTEVQVTAGSLTGRAERPLFTAELLRSGLVGMWANRTDIADSQEFARRLREQAQSRRQG